MVKADLDRKYSFVTGSNLLDLFCIDHFMGYYHHRYKH